MRPSLINHFIKPAGQTVYHPALGSNAWLRQAQAQVVASKQQVLPTQTTGSNACAIIARQYAAAVAALRHFDSVYGTYLTTSAGVYQQRQQMRAQLQASVVRLQRLFDSCAAGLSPDELDAIRAFFAGQGIGAQKPAGQSLPTQMTGARNLGYAYTAGPTLTRFGGSPGDSWAMMYHPSSHLPVQTTGASAATPFLRLDPASALARMGLTCAQWASLRNGRGSVQSGDYSSTKWFYVVSAVQRAATSTPPNTVGVLRDEDINAMIGRIDAYCTWHGSHAGPIIQAILPGLVQGKTLKAAGKLGVNMMDGIRLPVPPAGQVAATGDRGAVAARGQATILDPSTGQWVPVARATPVSQRKFTAILGRPAPQSAALLPGAAPQHPGSSACALPTNPRSALIGTSNDAGTIVSVDPYFATADDRVMWMRVNQDCFTTPPAWQADVVAAPVSNDATPAIPTAGWIGIGLAGLGVLGGLAYLVMPKARSSSRRSRSSSRRSR